MLKLVLSIVLLMPVYLMADVAYAADIAVTGNGQDSNNEVSVNSSNNTTVQQTNSAKIDSNVSQDANTGENSATGNNGSASIGTGDITYQASIATSANNSVVGLECCPISPQTSLTISGNGQDTSNDINTNLSTSTQITINNIANLNNQLGIQANTGWNTADNNSSSVSINTGNISVAAMIKNHNINVYDVTAPAGSFLNIISVISGNGQNSSNIIDINLQNKFNLLINNLAQINNVLDIDAKTGGNKASGNNDDVLIQTGDVSINAQILNDLINEGKVSVSCCPKDGGGPAPAPSPQPAPAPISQSAGGGSSGGGGSAGQVLAAAAGQILPVTGSYLMLLMTILSSILFLLGLYLRLHPGQDPGLKLAYC